MSLFGKKSSKTAGCTTCKTWNIVTAVLLGLVALAAAIGVYKAHALVYLFSGNAGFGNGNQSLSLIAFALSLTLLHKQCKACCGCDCALPAKK